MLRSMALVLFCISPVFAAEPPSTIVATVGGESIRLDEIDAVIRVAFTSSGPLSASELHSARTAVGSAMIDEKLLNQFLKERGPKIAPADVDQMWKGLLESLRKQGQTLASYLRDAGQTEAEVREQWLRQMQFAKLIEQQATQDQLRAYHVANKEVFDRVKLEVAHIVLRPSASAPATERSECVTKLKAMRAELVKNPEGFAAAAKKYSICPTAPKGGTLGWITRKHSIVDEPFAAAAFALPVGAISEPVETEYGIHLIQVLARDAGTPRTFEQAIDDVRDEYTDDVRTQLIAKLRATAKVALQIP